eukprot:TRINITY_DN2339_c0_g1_i1.p1 TRINITY_DN2339_c0_g1~~TRINITY_DN2339_c0_g1_i1.p1  ORF type:complete len:237 (+),score=52.02 TRINITY_DN2339_c0_g1_i1:41-712(+)
MSSSSGAFDYIKYAKDAFDEFYGYAQSSGDPSWKLVKDEGGVAIYTQRYPGSSFDMAKGVGIIRLPLATIIPLIKTVEQRKPWSPAIASEVVLEELSNEDNINIVLQHVTSNKVAVVSPRDFVSVRIRCPSLPDGSWAFATKSVPAHPDHPPTPSGVVRGQTHIAGMVLRPIMDDEGKEATEVTWMAATDPKGWIPVAVINAALISQVPIFAMKKHLEEIASS